MEPGFPQAIVGNADPAKIPFAGGSSGRRTALANWIASPENPLTARVMVNRLWQHHFGTGIVATPSDFGINGERPTHPELLDWLATQLVAKKWSLKAMHRLMLTSNTYQQSAESPDYQKFSTIDPKNQLLWRMNWSRLEGEAIRDSVLSVTGQLQKVDGGPGAFVTVPADVAAGFEFFKWFPSDEKTQSRRTIYTFQRRSVMNPLVEVFDGANMSEVCSRRSSTVVPNQAFSLMNSEFMNNEAKHFADRVIELAVDRKKKKWTCIPVGDRAFAFHRRARQGGQVTRSWRYNRRWRGWGSCCLISTSLFTWSNLWTSILQDADSFIRVTGVGGIALINLLNGSLQPPTIHWRRRSLTTRQKRSPVYSSPCSAASAKWTPSIRK